MKLIKLSNMIFLSEEDINIDELVLLLKYELIPELRKIEEENLVHDLYLEDFLDSDNY